MNLNFHKNLLKIHPCSYSPKSSSQHCIASDRSASSNRKGGCFSGLAATCRPAAVTRRQLQHHLYQLMNTSLITRLAVVMCERAPMASSAFQPCSPTELLIQLIQIDTRSTSGTTFSAEKQLLEYLSFL